MWLRSVYFKTLRDHRIGAFAWGLGPGLLLAATLTQFEKLVGTEEARGALVAVAQQFAWYEAPIGITRPGGFATFRLGPMLAILPSIWALLAASRTLRGEEERGALDVVLAAPLSRGALVVQKLAGLATALGVMAAVLGTLAWVAGIAARAEYGALEAYVFGLNVALTAAAFGAIALLISQFVGERSAAAGITGAALALSFLLHSTGRVAPELKWLGYLSPLYYAGLTKPLVPEVGISPGGMLVLAAITAVCAAVAAWLFTRRDLGFALRLRAGRDGGLVAAGAGRDAYTPYATTGEWSLRSVYLRALRVSGRGAVWWAAGAAGYAVWMTAVGKQLQTNMTEMARSSPVLSAVFARLIGGEQGSALFLSMLVFTFLPLVLSAFAISEAARWSAAEEEGRTDMLLASPIPRPAAILAHFAASATVLVGLVLLLGAAVGSAAAVAGLALDPGNVLAASLALVPVLLVIACVGALLSGWLRAGPVSALLTAYVLASFVLVFIGPIFGWPEVIIALSVYDAYGSPLVDGWSWEPMGALLAVAALCLAGATYRFSRKDLAR